MCHYTIVCWHLSNNNNKKHESHVTLHDHDGNNDDTLPLVEPFAVILASVIYQINHILSHHHHNFVQVVHGGLVLQGGLDME